MSNMSYCMFQNTRNDLKDCVNRLHDMMMDGEELSSLSDDERSAARSLQTICEQYVELLAEMDDGE